MNDVHQYLRRKRYPGWEALVGMGARVAERYIRMNVCLFLFICTNENWWFISFLYFFWFLFGLFFYLSFFSFFLSLLAHDQAIHKHKQRKLSQEAF